MNNLTNCEKFAYEVFLIIDDSANATGESFDEDNIWLSIMKIYNVNYGNKFQYTDAIRMAVNRISQTISVERLEELYELACGRELCFERPYKYEWELRDKTPDEVKSTLSSKLFCNCE